MVNSKVGIIIPFGIILILYCIPLAITIKCWECRSDGDPKCADPFDNRSLPIVDCSTKPNKPHLPGLEAGMCRKIRQKVNGHWRYVRSCAWLGETGIGGDERYCERKSSYNIHVEYCTCKGKDGCNAGYAEKASKLLNALLVFIVVTIFMCLLS